MSGRRRRAWWAVAALALGAVSFAAPLAAGWRVNTSASLPRGLYRLERRSPRRGDLALACAPRWAGELAARRGYLPPGRCGGGVEPLGKIVLAVAGDEVEVRPEGLALNGRPIAGSGARDADRAGRMLPHLRAGRYRVAEGEVWLFSPHPRSFDSRYFGAVPEGNLIGVLSPVWTESAEVIAAAQAVVRRVDGRPALDRGVDRLQEHPVRYPHLELALCLASP